MKLEKVMINGKGYYHYLDCGFLDPCERCCFLEKNGSNRHCELPFRCEAGGYYIHCNEKPIEIGGAKIYVDVPPPPEPDKADKRSYYSFPNGVEAEDICRYLSFNLGNVVKYVCRVERMDGYKKIEDLEKARDYLDNEIERLKEEFGNEIQRMKDKIAKEKKGDD